MISILSPKELTNELVEKVFSLDKNYFPHPWSLPQWKNLIGGNSELLYLLHGESGDIRGFALFEVSKLESLGHLYKILVVPEFRGHKIGKNLMEKALKDLKERKIDRVYLEVSTSNSVAINFYKSFNFEILTKKQKFYSSGDDAFAMQRIL